MKHCEPPCRFLVCQDRARMALVPCIAISTGYILLIMFLCEMLRKLVAPLNDGLVKTALNEAIAAADLCGVCFELIIGKNNGNYLHIVSFLNILLQWQITMDWLLMVCICSWQLYGGQCTGVRTNFPCDYKQ